MLTLGISWLPPVRRVGDTIERKGFIQGKVTDNWWKWTGDVAQFG